MRLITIDQLEPVKDWYIVNPFVKTGYRPVQSPLQALRSLFQWHNETLSIYTHFLPGLVWLWMFCTCTTEEYFTRSSSLVQFVIRFSYFGAACLGLTSGVAHTFHIVNRQWATLCWKLDYSSIIIVNLAHQLVDSVLLFSYSPMICQLLFTLECMFAAFCIKSVFTDPAHQWGILYPIISSTVLTIPVGIVAYSQSSANFQYVALCSFLCSVCILLAGSVFYVGKLPERFWNPGNIFDTVNSHVWHHVLIVTSIVIAFDGARYFYLIDGTVKNLITPPL